MHDTDLGLGMQMCLIRVFYLSCYWTFALCQAGCMTETSPLLHVMVSRPRAIVDDQTARRSKPSVVTCCCAF